MYQCDSYKTLQKYRYTIDFLVWQWMVFIHMAFGLVYIHVYKRELNNIWCYNLGGMAGFHWSRTINLETFLCTIGLSQQ